ncbi:COBRA-like protein 1 [Euphorbia lathyris]|uniref:COBRA-like protein 1 n=1 Tax=Euphorbia lathyris TaxID=212925 RepID=UPI0033136BD3
MSSFLLITTILLVSFCNLSECYDTLDPNGEITVTFDIITWTDDGYKAKVSIENMYAYRQIGKPGWKIGWTWTNKEVIWSMAGAFATSQGDCTSFPYKTAHCCQQKPEIADWDPDTAPPELRSEDCCHGGVLSAKAIQPENSFSSFEITVGNLNLNQSDVPPPANLTLLAPGPGYTCSPILLTQPSQSSDIGGKRKVQVYRTWKSTCTYSSFVANRKPVCCVSLSTFYNPKVTNCPDCSCGCKESQNNTLPCISDVSAESSLSNLNSVDLVKCSDHMCPVGVHWHIKNIYTSHWRVKLTISNYNYKANYSDWNVLVQHPAFTQKITSYSFNKTILSTVGFTDKVAIFWGIEYVNSELIQAKEQVGSVSTEILIEKDWRSFTLSNGWGFPRRVYFGGDECQMPLPDSFPMLPNGSSTLKLNLTYIFLLFLPYLTCIIMHPQYAYSSD